ncbi:hypothetical protein KAU19_02895 [Candidatus Parcubacteria bacterium]|nr:hypothetical protein [Candidatus Parcubacteria bacterium]
MFKNQKQEEKNNTAEEKIPWYRRRWFWGVVLAPILIFGFMFLIGTMIGIGRMSEGEAFHPSIFLTYLSYGFILGVSILIPLEIPAYPFYVKTIFTPLSHCLTVIYCLILLFLCYKTCKEKRVKIKYPIILLVVFIFSMFGYILLLLFSAS